MVNFDDVQIWQHFERVVKPLTLDNDFGENYYKLHVWSEVFVNSLKSINFNVVSTNCTEEMHITAHF